MAQKKRRSRDTFRKLERLLTRVILGTLAGFLLMLVAAATGVGWLKWLIAVPVVLVSVLGCTLLVLKQEHKRRRSWWMLAAFASLALCTLVSLIAGYPAPPVA